MDNISLQNYITWFGTFSYNCTRGHLKNEGRGKLHEIKRGRNKMEINNVIQSKQISFESLTHEMKSNLCNVFILKYASIT